MKTIRFTHAKKTVSPETKTMVVQLDYEGDLNPKDPTDAMTLFADWFCKEVRSMGYDPVVIIQEINRLGADA